MKLGIGGKITLSIGLSVLLISIIAGIFSYVNLTRVFQSQTYTHLESLSALKENSIKELLDELTTELELFNNSSAVRTYLTSFLIDGNINSKEVISTRSQDLLKYKRLFSYVFVMDKTGMVAFSTNIKDEGKIQADQPYFVNSKEKTFIQNFYYDLSLGMSSMVIATPIKGDGGEFLGVLAAGINLDSLNTLMAERSGLGLSGETFLVNSSNLVVTDLLKQPGEAMKETIYLPQIENCLQGKSDDFNLPDYHGDLVLGYYHWLPELNSCLVTKIDDNEAMAPAFNVISTLISILFAGAFVMGLVGFVGAEIIVSPIKRLHDSMVKIKEGNFDVKSDVSSNDEVGDMAESFNEMTEELKKSYSGLEEKVEEKTKSLEEKVDELEKLNKQMVGRELTMIELKKKLREKENGKN